MLSCSLSFESSFARCVYLLEFQKRCSPVHLDAQSSELTLKNQSASHNRKPCPETYILPNDIKILQLLDISKIILDHPGGNFILIRQILHHGSKLRKLCFCQTERDYPTALALGHAVFSRNHHKSKRNRGQNALLIALMALMAGLMLSFASRTASARLLSSAIMTVNNPTAPHGNGVEDRNTDSSHA